MAEIDLSIAGRQYRVACRAGEEDNLRRAASLVDAKSREAITGLGTLSEARQLLFASLLLADQLLDGHGPAEPAATTPEPAPAVDPALESRVRLLAERLEGLADKLDR